MKSEHHSHSFDMHIDGVWGGRGGMGGLRGHHSDGHGR